MLEIGTSGLTSGEGKPPAAIRSRSSALPRLYQPLDPIAGKALFEVLSQLIPLKEIMLYIRNDKWFLDISGYPLIYPFAPEETPPAKEVFQQSHTLLCGRSVLTKESSCTLVSGH
jgi:hypothetical protein